MSEPTLCLFKSSRRLEYTLENLGILSGAVGDEVDVTYLERWIAPDVLDQPPREGDVALVVLGDWPYAKTYPIRKVRIQRVTLDGGALRMTVLLQARLHADPNRWKNIVDAGPNPLGARFVCRLPVDDGTVHEVPDEAADLREWKGQVDHVGRADGYARIAFVRIGAVTEVGGAVVPQPLQLQVGRMYEVEVISHNKHLDPAVLSSLRLVAFPDPVVMDVAMDEVPLPVDGSVSVTVEPQAEGPALLELSVMRGSGETWGGTTLTWGAIAAPSLTEVPSPPHRPEQASPPSPEGAAAEPVEASADVLAVPDVVPALMHSYRLLRDELVGKPELRLRIIEEWLRAAPSSIRLLEQRGILLHDMGRYEEATALLETLSPEGLDPEARRVLVVSWFRCGRLPEPIDRVTMADFSRDDTMDQLLEASLALPAERQVLLTKYLADRVISDARTSRWLERVTAQPVLARGHLLQLLDLWQYVDPDAAAAAAERLIDEGRLDLVDPQLAQRAFDLALACDREGLARRSAYALLDHHEAARDASALESLLGEVRRLSPDVRREVSEEVVRAIADVVAEDAAIDVALQAACGIIEDLRQRGELDDAAGLGQFVLANRHRGRAETAELIDDVTRRLSAVLEESETIRRYLELRRVEQDQDLRDRISGQRFLVVGSRHAEWWDTFRADFGLSDRCEWVETEKRQTPDTDAVIRKLAGVDVLVIQTGRIGHKLSKPLIDAVKEREVTLVRVDRPTRDALIEALRRDLGVAR